MRIIPKSELRIIKGLSFFEDSHKKKPRFGVTWPGSFCKNARPSSCILHGNRWSKLAFNITVNGFSRLNPSHTVDGRNPAPIDRWFIPLFIGFHTSQVVQDFSHQQYYYPSLPKSSKYLVRIGVKGPPKGLLRRCERGSIHTYSQGIWKTRETLQVFSGQITQRLKAILLMDKKPAQPGMYKTLQVMG